MFKIGDFSKITRLPVSALRYYADIGLLEPQHIEAETGYRYYSLEQVPRLNRILALRDLGLSLHQIKEIMQEELPLSELKGMLKLKEKEVQQAIEAEESRLSRVRYLLQAIEKAESGLPLSEVILKDVPAQWVYSLREVIPVGDTIAVLMGEAALALMAAGAKFTAAPMTLFHDLEFKEQDLDIEIAFPLEQAQAELLLSNERTLKSRLLEALPQVASLIHIGDYERFPESYAHLGRWIEANGYQITGAAREIYLRPPSEESEAISEIQFPIERQ
jgi:DNA-binding transcriptional MerR regulator/effector-binding domain-containing protein